MGGLWCHKTIDFHKESCNDHNGVGNEACGDKHFITYMQVCYSFDFAIVDGKYVGEDYLFCDRATQMGFKVYIDVDISLPHIGSETFTSNFREEVVVPLLKGIRESRLKVVNG